ncbi:MAG TPA: hypothetical protein VM327_09630 [Candidatus Thermoplasmatota archaeon]|nr:hypothetical protein [Candidatus Thermoplasmatota archaeon]
MTVAICDAGSAAGCVVPGASHLCIELRVASQPTTTLACIDHALVPPPLDSALHDLSPIEVGHPGIPAGGLGSTPTIQVTYLYEAALLNPVLVACAPVHPTPEDVDWFLGKGGETSLTVTLKGAPAPEDAVSIPWLGQVIAASQATAGVVPCG